MRTAILLAILILVPMVGMAVDEAGWDTSDTLWFNNAPTGPWLSLTESGDIQINGKSIWKMKRSDARKAVKQIVESQNKGDRK